ncbi:MAG: RNase adapter RapZ [Pseudomonadota bacterium]
MRIIIVSGLSGAGKSITLHMLEDLGYYCVDNLPVALLAGFVEHTHSNLTHGLFERCAVGVDARNPPQDIAAVPEVVARIRDRGIDCDVIYLSAAEEALIKRYSETRRRHPLTNDGHGLRDALAREHGLMLPISSLADLIIDTTHTNVHQLRELVRERIDQRASTRLSLLFQSFAYRNGVPSDADFVFDVRSLPNPHWHPDLRPQTGLDEPVREFLDEQPSVNKMFDDVRGFLTQWIGDFEKTNRSYLTVAIGCTGGQHRSVYMASRLARHFSDRYTNVLTQHRELPG